MKPPLTAASLWEGGCANGGCSSVAIAVSRAFYAGLDWAADKVFLELGVAGAPGLEQSMIPRHPRFEGSVQTEHAKPCVAVRRLDAAEGWRGRNWAAATCAPVRIASRLRYWRQSAASALSL